VLILRIKQAECALADGRLDEACELAGAADLREHRKGQDLAGRVARALAARGRTFLASGQVAFAGADCEKAVRLAGHVPEVADLRAAVAAALLDKRQTEQQHAQVIAAAQRQIQQGQLSVGQRILNGVHDGAGQAAALLQDLAARRTAAEAIADKAAAALDRDDWEAAIDELARAGSNSVSDSRLRDITARTARLVAQRAQETIESGRLDLATSLLKRLSRLPENTVDAERVQRLLDQCRRAWSALQAGQPRQAEQVLRRLAALLPSAAWITSALKSLEQASQATDQLRCSPLGLLDDRTAQPTVPPETDEIPHRQAAAPAIAPARLPSADGNVSPKLMIQVDGVGSFLVLRQPRITIGPLSSSPAPDLGLLAESSVPPVCIHRIEEDYFLSSANHPQQRGKLLTSGQRILLSPRCRLTFRLPSPASTTALLDLHSARMPRGDVRQVILLDRELILGPGPGSHIRADELAEPAMLYVRDGKLFCRTKDEVTIDGRPADKAAAIPIGSHIGIGSVTFVVTLG